MGSETGWECGWAEVDCIHGDQDVVAGKFVKLKKKIEKYYIRILIKLPDTVLLGDAIGPLDC